MKSAQSVEDGLSPPKEKRRTNTCPSDIFSYICLVAIGGIHKAKVFSCPLWEIRSFNDRGITITLSARALVMLARQFCCGTPYQAECGVLSVVYFCQGPAKPPTK